MVESSAHPKLDFVGREGMNEADANRKHFIVIFDPDTNEVDLIEAPKVVMYQSLRETAPEEEKKPSHVRLNAVFFADRQKFTLRDLCCALLTCFCATTADLPRTTSRSNRRFRDEESTKSSPGGYRERYIHECPRWAARCYRTGYIIYHKRRP